MAGVVGGVGVGADTVRGVVVLQSLLTSGLNEKIHVNQLSKRSLNTTFTQMKDPLVIHKSLVNHNSSDL